MSLISPPASAGRPIRDVDTLARIKRLAIPPAWTDVWICPDPRGHLQATGRDARGRKQYRYHPRWRDVRDAVKYDRVVAFAEALPRIRERTDRDLERHGMPREIDRHVNVIGSEVRFSFRGKSGKHHTVELHDRRMARIIKRFLEIPGQELFQYLDENGEAKPIDSADVNDYLREITGEDFTAKDFRTWAGTILAARFLRETAEVANPRGLKKQLVRAIARVADELGNTPAVAKKGYIHPAVSAAYLSGGLLPISEKDDPDPYRLLAEERSVLAVLPKAA
jgi:DNA topoisomerase-1